MGERGFGVRKFRLKWQGSGLPLRVHVPHSFRLGPPKSGSTCVYLKKVRKYLCVPKGPSIHGLGAWVRRVPFYLLSCLKAEPFPWVARPGWLDPEVT